MPYETKIISKEQATACLKIITDYIERIAGPGWEPALYPPGHEGNYWCVSLEGADEWAIKIQRDETVTWPAGVWTEPAYSWCLALHPTDEAPPSKEREVTVADWQKTFERMDTEATEVPISTAAPAPLIATEEDDTEDES